RILTAEKAATLAALANSAYEPDRRSLAAAWRHSLLIDEHTWHADCSVRDPESEQAQRQGAAKDAHATDAQRELDRVLRRSLSALADASPDGPGSLLVFNPSSWPREGVMEVEVGRGLAPVDETTGRVLPHEILRAGRVYQRLRVLLPPVPALGVRALPLRPALVASRTTPATDPWLLENEHYRVRVDPSRGGIGSLWDKALARELVAPGAAHALGQWVYVVGGDTLPNRLVQYSTVSPIPALTLAAATFTGMHTSVVTAAGARARWGSVTTNFPSVETEVFLPVGRREVHLTLRVRKVPTLAKEAAYVAFPFATGTPRFRYATQNGWVDPAKDLLPGACHEWFTVSDWVSVEGAGLAVTLAPLDAPLVTLGDVVRGTWPETMGDRPATIFSYVMSNYTPEGYAAQQGGDFVFRYVLTSDRVFDAAASARFGAEQLTPLESNEITRADKLGAGEGVAWLRTGAVLEPASVQVSTWKPAEDGRGTILRLVETSGTAGTVSVTLPAGGRWRINRCNAVEDDLDAAREVGGTWSIPIAGFGLETVRVQPWK
ncbi:MAG: hypothetical protein IT580_02075, partial [Verrucomicrobiales bacterium]|nr:hypothetical protein [Verrucomicrobiales bacterium]